MLDGKGLSTTVADLRFAKPLDEELIRRLLTTHEVAVTVEEAAIGGLGAHVLTLASDEGLIDAGLKLRTMRLPDRFQDQDKPEKQYDEAGLDADAHRRDGAEGAAPQQRRAWWRARGPEIRSLPIYRTVIQSGCPPVDLRSAKRFRPVERQGFGTIRFRSNLRFRVQGFSHQVRPSTEERQVMNGKFKIIALTAIFAAATPMPASAPVPIRTPSA